MKHKVILALGPETVIAAGGPKGAARSKKSKEKVATNAVIGTLKGLVKDAIEDIDSIEQDINMAAELIETIETDFDNDVQLHAAGGANLTKAVKELIKVQKAAVKFTMKIKSQAEKVSKEMEKARMAEDSMSDFEREAQDQAQELMKKLKE